MPDIINLLPDSVANQIAAGEVIQRPASAVKELLENAIDAGATDIKLIIKDAGRTLIQVIDNGSGMSETDARMSFERHATSKITKADDLFNIHTKGFRGEALASIAAIAQVELKTRKADKEIGTLIEIEGSEVKQQQPCSCPVGTSFSIKNLFFNVPARRNFLKSDTVEFRHIMEEWERVAIPHPEISFSIHHNNNLVLKLDAGNLKQRIVSLFYQNFNERLVPIEQTTNIVKLTGFICKPEYAKKTRGEQYFFVNNRFIKSAYLHHAIQSAYSELISKDSYASYFILMEVDPRIIDINIHPTKTEIKFEDEKAVYSILRSTVKLSLGKYNVSPTIDFEQESAFNTTPLPAGQHYVKPPTITVNPNFNPFDSDKKQSYQPKEVTPSVLSNKNNWAALYENMRKETEEPLQQKLSVEQPITNNETQLNKEERYVFQLHKKYIVSPVKSGLMIINQQGAHERILYEEYLSALHHHSGASQQSLFPQTLELSSSDFDLYTELQEEVKALGFDISLLGKQALAIQGIPASLANQDGAVLLESLLEEYKHNLMELKLQKHQQVALALARKAAIKNGQTLEPIEMNNIIDALFACEMPNTSPIGKKIVGILNVSDIEKIVE